MFLEHTDVFLFVVEKEKNKQQYTRFTFLLGSRDTDAMEAPGNLVRFLGPFGNQQEMQIKCNAF